MTRYHLNLQPQLRSGFAYGQPGLTPDAIALLIPDATVHEITSDGPGYGATLDIELERQTREEEINEISAAAQRLGYSIVNGEVSAWVNAETQGIIAGAISGAGFGFALEKPEVALILAIAGGLAGSWVASRLAHYEPILELRRPHRAGPLEFVAVQPELRAYRGSTSDCTA